MSVNQISAFNSFNLKVSEKSNNSQAVNPEKKDLNTSNNSRLSLDNTEQKQLSTQPTTPTQTKKDYSKLIWYATTAIASVVGFVMLGKNGYLGTKIQNFFTRSVVKNKNSVSNFGRIKNILGKNYQETLDGLKKAGIEHQTSELNGQKVIVFQNKSGNKIILEFQNDKSGILQDMSVLHPSGSQTDIGIIDGKYIGASFHSHSGIVDKKAYDSGKFKAMELYSIDDLQTPFYGKEYIKGGYREYVRPEGEIRYAHKAVNGNHKFWTFIPEDSSNKRIISADDYKNALFNLFYNSDRQINIKLKE